MKSEKSAVVERVLAKAAKRYPHALALNPKERWRAYFETTVAILELAQEPKSIERFVAACNLLKKGFAVASKSPVDELLDVQSWVDFGFRILCASPKATDWSVTDRDDSAITHEDKERMLEGILPLLRAMLGWANKVPTVEGKSGGSLDALSFEVIKQIKMREANYWESAMRRKIFTTDPVTRLSQYDTTFFKHFLHSELRFSPATEIAPPPPLSEAELTTRILCDLSNSHLRYEQHKFFYQKDNALDEKIKSERKKWKVDSFDLEGLTAAVADALSDNPTGKGLTMKMYDDLRTLLSHDWMASVSSDVACSTSRRVIFTREEQDQFCELISAIKEGFKNRAQKAETKKASEDWQNAAEMVSSTLRRVSLGQEQWELILSLIANRRAKPLEDCFQLDFMTKGTAAYKKFHRDLDGLIARITDRLPPRPSYAREYVDYLIALRDGTLDPDVLNGIADIRNHGLVLTEEDSDLAYDRLEADVRFYLQRLHVARLAFESAGRMGGKDLLCRYQLIQPQGIATGLYLFDPGVFSDIILPYLCPLTFFSDFEHDKDVLMILQGILTEWEQFFETVILAVPGKSAFIAARNAYAPLREQLELQFGVLGNPYRTPEERKELYETFKEKLNDLAMTVFECDSQRMQSAAKPAAPSATGAGETPAPRVEDSHLGQLHRELVVPAITREEIQHWEDTTDRGGDVSSAQKETNDSTDAKKLKVGSWAKKFLTADFKTRTITFKPGKDPITGKSDPLVISETANKAWAILVELLTASSDTEGYVAINDANRPWQTVLKQFVPKGRKDGIVDIYAPMTILRYHIHSEKKRGEPGRGRLRIQPEVNVDLFRDEERRYKQWKAQHNG